MKSIIFKCAFFLIALSSLFSFEYELTICAIFQDDAKYIPEWIEFHQKQGVEHFFLYNNLSKDNYMDYLLPYIERGIVELKDWSFEYKKEKNWNKVQSSAYDDCIKKNKDKVKWCAFIDTDEFLFNPSFKDLRRVLDDYEEFPGVVVHWVMYGTSGVPFIPEGEKMLDHLVWRQKLGSPQVKSIVRLQCVKNCRNPHHFIYKDTILAVDENKKEIKKNKYFRSPFTASILRINHYWSRDLEFFHEVKIARRMKWNFEYKHLLEMEAEMNEIYDPILWGF